MSSSKGVYNPTYFKNHPQEATIPAVLYCVILVNRRTFEREAIKIGIAKGSNYRDVIKRAAGFKGYDVRIQKIVKGNLEDIYYLEEFLHEKWDDKRLKPTSKFGGWTECFQVDDEIIKSIPSTV
jgi:hypothetical protein